METAATEAVERLVAAIPHASWFAAVGEELTGGETEECEAWLAVLGFGDCQLERAEDWEAAARVTADPDWDKRWWQAEEDMRESLLHRANARFGEAHVMELLSEVSMAAHDATIGAAARAAANAGVANPALIAAAAGAATQACYQAALALLGAVPRAGNDDHPFAVKLRLFLAGRWPLGILGGRAYIF